MIASDPFVSVSNDLADNTALNSARLFTLETNDITFHANDQVAQGHFAPIAGHDIFVKSAAFGTWQSAGGYKPIEIIQGGYLKSNEPGVKLIRAGLYSLYVGGGGGAFGQAPPFLDLEGPNNGSIVEVPMNGKPVTNLLCPGYDSNCSTRVVLYHVNGAGVNQDSISPTVRIRVGLSHSRSRQRPGPPSGECVPQRGCSWHREKPNDSLRLRT